ncbi:MAG TPA: acetyl-CoA carboxylase, carboxyltransferase subunit beta [Thermohalobaculum sp.]|nr:acetyl-CoA carboxylase, carboxyltransferase subunit beta [Thermohalobaculum sp.]
MNWITEYVPPKLKSFFQRRETPENLWLKCDDCGQMIFHRDFRDNLHVCSNCGHHMQIAARDRFATLFDNGAFETIAYPEPTADPLHFRDQKRYSDRLRETRRKTGEDEAILVAAGPIHGLPTVAAAHDFAFMGGSMGMAVGNAMLAAAETAVERRSPLVVFPSAGGARMQEGILSLMQMPRTAIAVEMMRDARLPYIVVLTHPTTGGVTASYAMLGDIHIAEPDALICFAGPRVIEQTIREKLPEGFQRAEYLLDHGMIDRVVDRRAMRDELGRILRMLMQEEPMRAGALMALPEPAPE